jgi:S-adenosyl methyltransferase
MTTPPPSAGGTLQLERDFAESGSEPAGEVRSLRQGEQVFLTRAVIFMLDRGIRQFLDLGSGLPSAGGVQDMTAYLGKAARVVHVDSDPNVVEQGSSRVREEPRRTHFLRVDAADVDRVLTACAENGWLDLGQPIGVLAVGLLHLLARPHVMVQRYSTALAAGSVFAITHLAPGPAGGHSAAVERLIAGPGGSLHPRDHTEVASMLTALDIVQPGVSQLPYRWPSGLFPPLAQQAGKPLAILAGLGIKR